MDAREAEEIRETGLKMVWTSNGFVVISPGDPDGGFPVGTSFDEMQGIESETADREHERAERDDEDAAYLESVGDLDGAAKRRESATRHTALARFYRLKVLNRGENAHAYER